MSRRAATLLAWSVVGVSVVVAIAGLLVAVLRGASLEGLPAFVVALLVFVAASVVGALVASRQPSNPIGWIFCGFSAFTALSALAAGYAESATSQADRGSELTRAVAWFANWSYVSFFVLAIFVPLLFPDGRLLSPRWRVAAYGGGVGVVLFAAGPAFDPGPLHDYRKIENPFGLDGVLVDVFGTVGMFSTIAAIIAAVAAVVVRFRRSRGVERQQMKLLAAAGVIATVGIVAGGTIGGLGSEDAGNAIILLGILGIPLAIGVAMLRYRLYDVDRVISKTLVFGSLTVLLGAAYAGFVLLGQAVFSAFAGGSDLAIAVSTLLVAALFQPVRARIQRFVDRRFYRRRYDAQRTLETFGSRLREQVDLETLTADLRGVVNETMRPAGLSLWLRTKGTAP